ncbi:MAG: hypothetical protein ACE5H3_03285, partial [Planctomycetota bacterium]
KVNTAGKIRPTGAWTPGSQNGTPPTYTLNSVDVTGTLHTFLPIAYLGTDQDQKQVKMPIHAPGWNLDEYTLGGSRILLYNGVTQVNGLDTDKTAVFNLAPGQTLTLQDVNIRGGVVLFVEADYNPFDPAARNDLILLGNAVIGGGSGGAYAQIGLIAPGARLATSSASSSAVRKLKGLSMVHSIDTAKRLKVKGQLFVYTDIQAILDSQITYDEETAKDTPGGIFFFSGFPAVDVEKVSESYDPVAGL